jgi:hypothetical protein
MADRRDHSGHRRHALTTSKLEQDRMTKLLASKIAGAFSFAPIKAAHRECSISGMIQQMEAPPTNRHSHRLVSGKELLDIRREALAIVDSDHCNRIIRFLLFTKLNQISGTRKTHLMSKGN